MYILREAVAVYMVGCIAILTTAGLIKCLEWLFGI